ncbi:hypothetical protein SAMN04488096_1264 [Mesonia phycicola]|uniref:Uncharacterized protein n=1 Tax=Mesonia phycicola TaxID=579105 RepID=A0A1M6HWA6_9FLAO|nr:hypothetical protein [Mesonia phycicola]SHJ26481.1 hypothetical protein SAMN04488096_1264 [Mesonia phycicola]
MKNYHFENISFVKFLKLEFKNRKNSNGIFGMIMSLLELPLSGVFNYKIQKEWRKKYKLIEQNIVNFYTELDCDINGEKPNFWKLFKNYGTERIGFEFNKTHLAITSDSIFFFPYAEPVKKDYGLSYSSLQEPFRIIFDQNVVEKRKYPENKNLKFISIDNQKENTKLTLKVAELQNETELIFSKKLQLPTTCIAHCD